MSNQIIKKYVLAIATDKAGESIVVIRKKRPESLAGRLNGVGGKIEFGETPVEAMVREFREETGVETNSFEWKECGIYQGSNYILNVFILRSDIIYYCASTTDEDIAVIHNWKEYIQQMDNTHIAFLAGCMGGEKVFIHQ